MSRYTWLVLVVIATLLLLGVCTRIAGVPPTGTTPDTPPPQPNLLKLPTYKEAMTMKLKSSQGILEGIALSDFAKIQTSAEAIISVSNVADFQKAFKGKEYAFHLELFRRPAETIIVKAKEKNIDGVMIAFNDLTQSCLKCHQAIRDNRFEIVERRDGVVRE